MAHAMSHTYQYVHDSQSFEKKSAAVYLAATRSKNGDLRHSCH
jgi:hypothetical protein